MQLDDSFSYLRFFPLNSKNNLALTSVFVLEMYSETDTIGKLENKYNFMIHLTLQHEH